MSSLSFSMWSRVRMISDSIFGRFQKVKLHNNKCQENVTLTWTFHESCYTRLMLGMLYLSHWFLQRSPVVWVPRTRLQRPSPILCSLDTVPSSTRSATPAHTTSSAPLVSRRLSRYASQLYFSIYEKYEVLQYFLSFSCGATFPFPHWMRSSILGRPPLAGCTPGWISSE